MLPRKAPRTRTTPATATATTSMTDAAIRALISRGVADALAEHEIQRNNNLNGDGSQGSGSGITRPVRPTRECTYTDFLKCQPMNFKGTEGVIGLTQWFERIETKSHVKTVGHDAAYGVPWSTLMKMMTAMYCPRNEIKKDGDLGVEESDKIERYVGGLPDMIHGSVMASRPMTMQNAIEFATALMDKKIRTLAKRQAKNKRKSDNNNQAQ
ncbi:hypothetical protein Tco_1330023 [Tanacetum coccineum]